MKLFDSHDRNEIEWGLKGVFHFDVQKINQAIAAQVGLRENKTTPPIAETTQPIAAAKSLLPTCHCHIS